MRCPMLPIFPRRGGSKLPAVQDAPCGLSQHTERANRGWLWRDGRSHSGHDNAHKLQS